MVQTGFLCEDIKIVGQGVSNTRCYDYGFFILGSGLIQCAWDTISLGYLGSV